MTVDPEFDLTALKRIGKIVAFTLQEMIRPRMGSLCAQFEHTLVVRRGCPIVITGL